MEAEIDKFLDNIDEEDEEPNREEIIKKEGKVKKEKPIDLSFDEGLRKKFEELGQRINKEDFKFLVKAYEEVKKFDETLPSKLFGINKVSGDSVMQMGSKYSDEFLKWINNRANSLSSSMRSNLDQIDKALSENNFGKVIYYFNEVLRLYKIFPKEFIEQKIEFGKGLRLKEIKINEKFEIYKREELVRIREQIIGHIANLKQSLRPENILEIEDNISKLVFVVERIPKVFYSDLIRERTSVAKILIISEDFLKKEYEKDFNRKKEEIQILIDKYHKYQTGRNSSNALATYNEILILFGRMPDVFVKQKLDLYKQITSVFNGLNNLILSDNISYFMKIYEASKVIEDARDYIGYVKRTKRYNASIVSDFRNKLLRVPKSLSSETEELLKDLDLLDRENSTYFLGAQNKVEEIEPPKVLNDDKPTQEIVNPDSLEKFNSYYNKLKNEKDKEKAMEYYREIVFCLKSLNIDENIRAEILSKIEDLFKKNKVLEEPKVDMKSEISKSLEKPIDEKGESSKEPVVKSEMSSHEIVKEEKEKENLGLKDENLHSAVKSKVISEAYNYYNKLKNEKDKEKAIEDGRKIAFYLNAADIDKDAKRKILLRVRELVKQNRENGSSR